MGRLDQIKGFLKMCLLNLIEEVGINPRWVASTNGGEYHSACPKCGGKDRFFIQPTKQMKNCIGYYRCRKCDCSGDTIQFAIDFLRMDFKQAIERIGITLPKRSYFSNPIKKTFTPRMVNTINSKWQEKANVFVEWAQKNIWNKKNILKMLNKRGLPEAVVSKYKIGWCPQDLWRNKQDWEISFDKDTNSKLWLAQGIVIPSLEKNGKVQRIKIRRTSWKPNDTIGKYIAISGSMNGLSIIGDTKKEVMIIVESELDAYAVHNAVGDFAFVIAVGSNIKNPDNVTDYFAQNKSTLLICYDNDSAGMIMLDKWKKLYSHAQGTPTPIGKDVGEAIQQGLDLRSWIITKLPTQMQHDLNLIKRSWAQEDQVLINWFLNEKKLPSTPFVLSTKEHGDENITEPLPYYVCLRAAVEGGPDSWQARTKRLQEILDLLKILVEQNNSNTLEVK